MQHPVPSLILTLKSSIERSSATLLWFRPTNFRFPLRFLLSQIVLSAAGVVSGSEPAINYSRQIRPLLARACFSCHGPDAGTREAGLRLDRREHALAELDSGTHAIVSGRADASELFSRLTTADDSLRMPPDETGKTLTPEQIELIGKWIDQGAPYSEHWSFQAIQDPVPPAVDHPELVMNSIDNFILSRLEQEEMTLSPVADSATLVRRLSLDLLGLPPSMEMVNAFTNDHRPDAYARLVDELLDSPHFGERWGRHWLDLARYADSNGYLGDELRPEAYRYRDWVVNAINRDIPYRQFTVEQIAGDLLPNATQDQRIATGLHRNSMKNTEAGVDREADRVIQTVDRISTIGTAWLGLTVGCAECHSHKFDPLSHREFFQLYAFFNNIDEDNVVLGISEPKPEDPKKKAQREQALAELTSKLRANIGVNENDADSVLEKALTTLTQPKAERSEADSEALEHWRSDLDKDGRQLASSYEKLALQRPRALPILAPAVCAADKIRPTHVHHRGDFRQPGERVHPGTPEFLPPLNARGQNADRLDLALWLTRDDHPLTPRTAVNHLWLHLFGRGLVETVDNFGMAGSEPSHPELLDWLATRFMESGGSRKAMIRLIVMSSTYRQSSRVTPDLQQRDPLNVLLARQARLRLEGEIVRDAALKASGLLSTQIGGPGIRPPMNSRITQVSRNQEWKVSEGPEKYRRGMYIVFRRATPYPMLTMFDAPDSTTACARRERSNSPLQALVLLNDPVFFECAQKLGRDLSGLGTVPSQQWIRTAFERTLSRAPTSEELDRIELFYHEQLDLMNDASQADLSAIIGSDRAAIDLHEAAARVMVARGLMNLDEFITRE